MTKKQADHTSQTLWITDPWDTLDHPQDTSLRLMEEGWKLGVRQFWCDVKSVRMVSSQVILDAYLVRSISPDRKPAGFHFDKMKILTPRNFTWIHYRTDPPIDQAYLHPLQLLKISLEPSSKSRGRDPVVNPLEILLGSNEKVEAAALGDLMAPNLISSQWEHLLNFGKSWGKTVLKPLNDAQSHGVELLEWENPNQLRRSKKLIRHATQNHSVPVVLQKFLPGIADGEIRLWYLDGKLLAYVKKLPLKRDFRVNIDAGSSLQAVTLSKKQLRISEKISKHLKQRKIRMAAIDLIEDFITDFNFTSPGLIPQMERVLQENLAVQIVQTLRKP